MSKFKNKASRKGFSRPSIDLNRSGIKREWRQVRVEDLVEDDIIAGMGLVRMNVYPSCDGTITVCAGYPDDEFYFIEAGTEVLAFVVKEN